MALILINSKQEKIIVAQFVKFQRILVSGYINKQVFSKTFTFFIYNL